MIRRILLPLLIIVGFGLAGCQDFGTVEQGITVAYDKDTKKVTIVKDVRKESDAEPNYTGVPALVVALPDDPAETGAVPSPGLCIKVDPDKNLVAMFNPKSGVIEEIPFEMIEHHKGVDVSKKHVLVYDAATDKAREFPQVNAAENTVTIYDRKHSALFTIKLSPAEIEKFATADWTFGDEVRFYFKEPGKALRFMNITKTDIFKR